MRVTGDVVKRFWSQVRRSAPDACWEWTGELSCSGHGRFKARRRRLQAHRVAYIIEHGPIPRGMVVCHQCDNPPCVNPAHLFLVAAADSMADAMRNGRRRGTTLGPEAVREIRLAPDTVEARKALAAKFGVSPKTIRDVMDRLTWRHVA